MPLGSRKRVLLAILCTGCFVPLLAIAQEADTQGRDLPKALAPLEFLVGRWKGQAVRKDDPALRFRGWTETHTWAWLFSQGKPIGLNLTVPGGKILERATLTFDEKQGRYRLEGKSAGASLLFVGTIDSSGKLLTLSRAEKGGQVRLTLRANSNYVRYTMTLDRKEEGAAVFTPLIEVGLTKEGESFAASSTAAERPRCIVTGGAATLTVTYQGQSYPICCTGCRDEFNENPEKYLKKLAMRAKAAGTRSDQPGASRVSRFEDAFAGDVEEPAAKTKSKMTGGDRPAVEPAAAKITGKPAVKPSAPAKSAARAASALRIAQNLEKSGKPDLALKSYRQLVKDYPGSSQARTATERIKAMEKQ
jgi:YHS domain-containing protein